MQGQARNGKERKKTLTMLTKTTSIFCLDITSLKELDAKALQTLSRKVNVIPIIAKGDTMTAEEKTSFKATLLRDLEEHDIKTFPTAYPDEVDGAEELLVSVTNACILKRKCEPEPRRKRDYALYFTMAHS